MCRSPAGQCSCRFGYLGLDEAAARQDLWQNAAAPLRDAAPQVRAAICTVLLDEMRRSLAVDAECFDGDELDRIQRRSQGSLRDESAVTEARPPVPVPYWQNSKMACVTGPRGGIRAGSSKSFAQPPPPSITPLTAGATGSALH